LVNDKNIQLLYKSIFKLFISQGFYFITLHHEVKIFVTGKFYVKILKQKYLLIEIKKLLLFTYL